MSIQTIGNGRLGRKAGAICASDSREKSVNNTVWENETNRIFHYHGWFIMSQQVLPIDNQLSKFERVKQASSSSNQTSAFAQEEVCLGSKSTVSKLMSVTHAIASKLKVFLVIVRENYIKKYTALLQRSLTAYVAWGFSRLLRNVSLEISK